MNTKELENKKDNIVKKQTKKPPAKKNVDRLLEIAKDYSGFEYYEDGYITKEQCAFLAVFERNLGNISNALKNINIRSRQTYYVWIKKNEHFKNLCEDIKEAQIDYVESKLQENIKKGNLIAQMFYLKTIGKNRGYVEKVINENQNSIEVIDFDFIEVEAENESKSES